MISKEDFIKRYTREVKEKNAAVFAGAGLSRSCGFLDWRELLKDFADELGLNLDREHDLTEVAQYYFNKNKVRSRITQKIRDEFSDEKLFSGIMEIFADMPIETYWTTNYDHLIENTLIKFGRNPDVKKSIIDFTLSKTDRDCVVYKMHGDVSIPENVVIIKNDYETYNKDRQLFTMGLLGDLVSKTFLFIGFSFEDPNLAFILSEIKRLVDSHAKQHYCFFEKIKDGTADFEYRLKKQLLKVEDLERYGIQTILLDNYLEIPVILSEVRKRVKSYDVYISGSIEVYSDNWPKSSVESFAYILSNRLIKHGFRVMTGFGLGIGDSVINGALNEVRESKDRKINEYLNMRPFPQVIPDGENVENYWARYREEIIEEAGVIITMFGNKISNNGTIVADGVIEEFDLAVKANKFVIPIATTEYAASICFNKIESKIDEYPYLKGYEEVLLKSKDIDEIVNTVIKILNGIMKS